MKYAKYDSPPTTAAEFNRRMHEAFEKAGLIMASTHFNDEGKLQMLCPNCFETEQEATVETVQLTAVYMFRCECGCQWWEDKELQDLRRTE